MDDHKSIHRSSTPPPAKTAQHPTRNGGARSVIPVTLAAAAAAAAASASPKTLTLALPTQAKAGSHGREDCWSEGATATLIEAWGERYLELNRGNLKHTHWEDVAEAVNSRDGRSKAAKTDVQCKNRVDTLKKKYKIEKARMAGAGGPSKWPFFQTLDDLIGPVKKSGSPSPAPLQIAMASNTLHALRAARTGFNNHSSSDRITGGSSSKSSPDSSESSLPEAVNSMKKRKVAVDRKPVRELTEAILKFGEVYERMEGLKMQQMAEMEKQRLGFVKELELQRMHFFTKAQLEIAQMKQPGYDYNHRNSSI